MISTIPRSQFLIFLFAFISAFALRLIIFVEIGYTTDDALIIFRYAENLATGHGFVYNEGVKVLGTSTPLFTLLLTAFLKLKINCFVSAFLLSNAADLITSWVLLNIFRNEHGPLSWLPAVLFLFSPESLQWSLSGMETEVYIAFIFLAFYFAAAKSWSLAFLFAGLAVFTRIDGIAVLGAIVIVYILRNGKLPTVPLAVFALTVLPWFLFAWFYFGSLIPNSAAAKWALSGENTFSAPAKILLRGFLHLHTFGIPVLILALAGTSFIWRERKSWLPLAIWTWGYAFAYTVASGPMHPWYYAPFYAGYLVLAFQGLIFLFKYFPKINTPIVRASFGSIAILIVLYLSYYRCNIIQRQQQQMNAMNRAVGEWVRGNSKKDAVLGAKDIGYIGYYSDRTVLDLAGLVSPECIPFRARADFLGPIRRFQPDYFAFSGGQARTLKLENDNLRKQYKVVHQITNGQGTYFIFKNVRMKLKGEANDSPDSER